MILSTKLSYAGIRIKVKITQGKKEKKFVYTINDIEEMVILKTQYVDKEIEKHGILHNSKK